MPPNPALQRTVQQRERITAEVFDIVKAVDVRAIFRNVAELDEMRHRVTRGDQ